MKFFDALLPIGRTNGAFVNSPCCEREALAVMDRFGVEEALVFHTLARDNNPDQGNAALEGLADGRLHKIWAFETAAVAPLGAREFLAAALDHQVRAVMVNPAARHVRVERSVRLLELAELLEARRIPLIAAYRQWDGGQDIIDWYGLADFCNRFPRLPVIAWQPRSRSNRPLFDALATTANLHIVLSSVWQAQMIECLCEAFGAQRVVFSLGLPAVHDASFPAVVAYADIGDEARLAVAGGTLRRMLREANYGYA